MFTGFKSFNDVSKLGYIIWAKAQNKIKKNKIIFTIYTYKL